MQTTWTPQRTLEETEPFRPTLPPRPADNGALRNRMEGAKLPEDHVAEQLRRLVHERNVPYPPQRRFFRRR